MKKLTNKYISIILIVVSFLALAGCSDYINIREKQNAPVSNSYTISGKFVTGTNIGSYEARTASTSFIQYIPSVVDSFIVFAKKGEKTCSTNAVFNETTKAWEYTIVLTETGKWNLNARMTCKSEQGEKKETWVSDAVQITVRENCAPVSKNIVMKPASSDICGSINLTYHDETGKVKSIMLTDSALPDTSFIIRTDDNGYATHCQANVAAGAHEYTIKFYDVIDSQITNNTAEIFSCIEAINVLSGFVTDTWYGDSSYLTKNEDGTSSFVITNEILSGYDKGANKFTITPTETPYVLWSNTNLKQAEGYCTEEGGFSERTGYQVFGDIKSGMTITNPFAEGLDDYCFDEKHMYVLEGTFLHIYEPSYSGYKKITDNPFNLASLLCDKRGGSDYRYSVEAIEFFKKYLYFSWSYWDDNTSQYEYGITRIKIPVSTDIADWNLATCEWACTTENINGIVFFEITDNMIYYYDGQYLSRRNYSVTSDDTLDYNIISLSSSNTENDDWEIDPASLGLDSTISMDSNCPIRISDIQLNGSILYATVYQYGYYQCNNWQKYLISNGGILKFPVDAETFEPAIWKNDIPVPKLLGWYTNPDIKGDGTDTLETLEGPFDGKAGLQPPLEQANNYFYGARKFIAKKPDELVIADDGGYIDNDSHKVHFKDRIVTVNLLTESLSVVDVNVTFSSGFNGSGYFENQ